MAIFITNLEVILASEEEVKIYYETATKKINALLEKYDIRNSKGKLEQVFENKLETLLTFDGFFQSTPLKSIFFDQKQQFIPQEIIHAFRSIISDPPENIKAIFFNKFISLLMKKGWDKPLSTYFEKQYNFPSDGTIILDALQDFSIGSGVYRATFKLRTPRREKVTVFLKGSSGLQSHNELLYFQLQKQFLLTASHAKMPFILSNIEKKENLLLSPEIPGASSDSILSALAQAYQKTRLNEHKHILKKSLEILIESFFCHAALGDLLGRNDRHLLNSLIARIVSGIPKKNTLETLNSPENILIYAKAIVKKKTGAFSLIDFDLAWLLGEKNINWMLADIDFGLSEINLLSLLAEFNDYNAKENPYYTKRRAYTLHYFNAYCQKQKAILKNKEILFSAIKKTYPSKISEDKIKILTREITLHEKNNDAVIGRFRRYLIDFRIRRVYKETLVTLHKCAKQSNHMALLTALKEAELLRYLPPQPTSISSELNVFLQLQCFRGVLSKQDRMTLSVEERTGWETVASNISTIAEKFDHKLLTTLQNKIQFIKNDASELLKDLQSAKIKEVQDNPAQNINQSYPALSKSINSGF